MNTVFKFGFQVWTLLAIAAAAAVPLVVRILRRLDWLGTAVVLLGALGLVAGLFIAMPGARMVIAALTIVVLLVAAILTIINVLRRRPEHLALNVWYATLGLLLAAGAVYPLAGIPSRLAVRFANGPRLTLDGLAFLKTAEYENEGHQIVLADDYAGIEWLNSKLAGLQLVFQSDRETYRAYGMRISANTGFPTILGSLHEGEQRPMSQLQPRISDVQTMFNSPDVDATTAILAKYGVKYVYIGPAERAFSDPAALPKWEQMVGTAIDKAFEQGQVTIYKVRPGLKAVTGTTPPPVVSTPPVLVDDAEVKALEAQNSADPTAGSTAYGLGQKYMQMQRSEDAARVLHIAADANPGDIALHQFLGDVEAGLGHADEAQTAWQQAVDADPSAGNYNKLATGLIKLGRWDAAEQSLKQALATNPSAVDLVFTLGELYMSRASEGDVDRAVQQYEQYLKTAPADAPSRSRAEQRLSELGK